MATTEHTINDALAGVLRETRRQGCGSLAAPIALRSPLAPPARQRFLIYI